MGMLWICILRVEPDVLFGSQSARKYRYKKAITTAKIVGTSERFVNCFDAARKLIDGRKQCLVVLMTLGAVIWSGVELD